MYHGRSGSWRGVVGVSLAGVARWRPPEGTSSREEGVPPTGLVSRPLLSSPTQETPALKRERKRFNIRLGHVYHIYSIPGYFEMTV